MSRGWPLDVRVEVARAVVEQHTNAHEAATRLGVPYTTALEWVRVYRKHGAKGLETPARIARPSTKPRGERHAAIVAAKTAEPTAGSRKIRDAMKRFFGIGASETTVRRVLKAEGLSPKRAKPRAKPQPTPHRFERAEPNQLWQSDLFTFLLRKHERVYVAAFLDDHSRYVVSLVIAHHQKSALVMEALQRGIADYGAPKEILTDQGRQYTAWRGSTDFEEELKRNGIQHIKSRPHHPQTCGKIERFWKTLWEEWASRTVFADFEDCQRRVALFVQHYNFQRPHQALDGMTPADRYFRSALQVRQVIEANVAANALRLAREQPARKPFYLVGRLGDRSLTISTQGATLKVQVGDEETVIPLSKEVEHDEGTSASRWDGGGARRKHRPRSVPRWLMKSQDLDAFARSRCLLVLSVLSGEQPVTDAIEAAHLSRATYYKLETRALEGMLAALNPLTAGPVSAPQDVTGPRVEALEAKVKVLQQEKRRVERLLLLTRKTLRTPVLKGRPGRPPKVPASTLRPRWRLPSSKGKAAVSGASTPTASGAAGS